MKEVTIVNEDNKVLKITFPDTPIEVEYELGQECWFYLQNSLEVNHGRVVGFFMMIEDTKDTNKRKYYYQVEYYVELKNGEMEMRLGTVSGDDMGTDEKKIKENFVSIRATRIEAAIRQGEVELGGAIANKQSHEELAKELEREIKRLKDLKK